MVRMWTCIEKYILQEKKYTCEKEFYSLLRGKKAFVNTFWTLKLASKRTFFLLLEMPLAKNQNLFFVYASVYPPEVTTWGLIFSKKKIILILNISVCVNHFYVSVTCRYHFLQKVQSDEHTGKGKKPSTKTKSTRCWGSHHFLNWRQRFGKKLEMSSSARNVLSMILSDIEKFQSYIPPTDVINFACQTMNEAMLKVH